MRKALALLFWFSLALGGAQAQDISPALSLTSGTTPTNCTALNLFYNDASSKFACAAGSSWDYSASSLGIGEAPTNKISTLGLGSSSNFLLNSQSSIRIDDSHALGASWGGGITFGGIYIGTTRTPFAGIRGVKENATSGNYSGALEFFTRTNGDSDWTGDQRMIITSAGEIRIGAADAAAAVAKTISVQGVVAGTSNTAGALWTLKLSASTGSAVGGDLDILGTPAGGAGSTQNSFVSFLRLRAADKSALFGSYLEMAEMTAPAAPAANGARLYCDDNGAGKTQCSIIFASGAAQQIAIEP